VPSRRQRSRDWSTECSPRRVMDRHGDEIFWANVVGATRVVILRDSYSPQPRYVRKYIPILLGPRVSIHSARRANSLSKPRTLRTDQSKVLTRRQNIKLPENSTQITRPYSLPIWPACSITQPALKSGTKSCLTNSVRAY
jgi:hypothetical protein